MPPKLEHMVDEVGAAYGRRAAEYTDLLGSMSAVHPMDRQLVSTWAGGLDGRRVLDAGCGPGHWTHFLAELGLSARGVDQVPEFIDRARRAYPGVPYELGDLDGLDCAAGSVDGILAWYSLIHHEPGSIRVPLAEFHRALGPHGSLLLGFFEGDAVERFDHAVTPGYRWPVDALGDELLAVGFDVVESHVRKTVGQRSLAAIIARRTDARESAPGIS